MLTVPALFQVPLLRVLELPVLSVVVLPVGVSSVPAPVTVPELQVRLAMEAVTPEAMLTVAPVMPMGPLKDTPLLRVWVPASKATTPP